MAHKFIPGIASQSLGNPQYHNIKPKLQAAASVGLRSVEIFYEDIAQLASQYRQTPTVLAPRFEPAGRGTTFAHSTEEQEVLLACARQIRQWCLDTSPHSLQVICLQPFMHFEGLLDVNERNKRMEKLDFWIHIAQHLGTTLIQIPSNFLAESECSGEKARAVEDLREAAKIGAQQTPVIRFAYEALCWGTHVNRWDAAWNIVKRVDMPNFGTCLDTFNIAGRVYADPESPSGKTECAELDTARSIQKLRDTFSDAENMKKVFYVELCDGERLDEPISPHHEWYNAEQAARMSWSRNARLFPFETDVVEAHKQGHNPGYLPVGEILDALLEVGYEGYLSFEVFNRSLNQPGQHVIESHAQRAGESWKRCTKHIEEFMRARSEANEKADTDAMSFIQADQQQLSSEQAGDGGVAGISSRL